MRQRMVLSLRVPAISLIATVSLVLPAAPGRAEDWPMWRYDANRSNASPQELPAAMRLEWVRQYPALEPAWEDPVNQDRMPFDRVYEPIVLGSTMFIGSNRNDSVAALDTRSGEERWRFYADGPVRFAPAAFEGKLYVASDDGFLYCLDASNGQVVWKFRGGPSDRRILGNGRMISTWPARGGPVVKDGVVYFAASIWPFMGVFIHALDAKTGKVVWTNDGLGASYGDQPHPGAISFSGLAPQGALAAIGDRLLVPNGRSVPACLDRRTGELIYFHLPGSPSFGSGGSADRKREGGCDVAALGKFFLNHRGLNTGLYDLESGKFITMKAGTTYPVLTESVCYLSGNPVAAYRFEIAKPESKDGSAAGTSGKKGGGKKAGAQKGADKKKGAKKASGGGEDEGGSKKPDWGLAELWHVDVDGSGALIKAGNRLYAGGNGTVSSLDLADDGPAKVSWTTQIEGTAARLVAADDRLFVVTQEGRIYAFGAGQQEPKTLAASETPSAMPPATVAMAREMLNSAAVKKGFALVYGLTTGDLVEALVRNSDFRVVAVDPDEAKVAALRKRFDAAGLYGTRISVHVGDPTTFAAPPYVAALLTSEDLASAAIGKGQTCLKSMFASLRPYGGVAYLPVADAAARGAMAGLAGRSGLEGAKIEQEGNCVVLVRQGALSGAADWTHQYGDISNAAKSDDRLVKAPLGVLWFGGNSHMDVLPRHGHGPSEQVIGGRLFIEGVNCFSARDVYTGQMLWKREFPDLKTFGIYYDKSYKPDPLDASGNQGHIPGANARGTNFVAAADKVYLAAGSECQVLDAATGETLATFSLPKAAGSEQPPTWGYVGVYEDLLIAGADLAGFSRQFNLPSPLESLDVTSSRRLVVMDRHTGKVLWTRDAELSFRHNSIAAGAGKLFAIDRLPDPVAQQLKRRGEGSQEKVQDEPKGTPQLVCLDVRTGQPVWTTKENVFGTWLGYSKEHDILIQSGRNSRDMIVGEPDDRIIAYHANDGSIVWDKPIKHGGPCMLHHDTIYFNAVSNSGTAVSLLTGEPKLRQHPLTGQDVPWAYQRTYGCNSVLASEYLLTFRSGAAGFYDLDASCGTGNLGGFKSGCTSNLIVANGVLNAPDYTRTCTCSYQNQTSLAMISMPENEQWSYDELDGKNAPEGQIARVGINFGAPGDRRADDGTLWLDYPSVGGPSPQVSIEVAGSPKYFRHHSSRLGGEGLAWVAASGVEGADAITVKLSSSPAGNDGDGNAAKPSSPSYKVRLVFAEPDENAKPGDRVFDVALGGKTVLRDFDIVTAAGATLRSVVKEFNGVAAGDELKIELTPHASRPAVLCGIEAVMEK